MDDDLLNKDDSKERWHICKCLVVKSGLWRIHAFVALCDAPLMSVPGDAALCVVYSSSMRLKPATSWHPAYFAQQVASYLRVMQLNHG